MNRKNKTMGKSGVFDFDVAFGIKTDTKQDITSRQIKMQSKIKFENKFKCKNVENLITDVPNVGESIHIVSNGQFDYFTIVPRLIELENGVVDEFVFSTWTFNRVNASQIIDLYDKGVIKSIFALTGDYLYKRDSATYAFMDSALKERGQKMTFNKNHAKVTLMRIRDKFLVIEGSANFTSNPRIENFIISSSEELYMFHRTWMMEIINK